MKRLPKQLSLVLPLAVATGVSSCSITGFYTQVTGQLTPVREDNVVVETGARQQEMRAAVPGPAMPEYPHPVAQHEAMLPPPPAAVKPTPPAPVQPTTYPAARVQPAYAAPATTGSAYPQAIVTVREGDTIAGIAGAYKITPEALCRENGLTPGRRLRSGMQLRIPYRSWWQRALHWPWFSQNAPAAWDLPATAAGPAAGAGRVAPRRTESRQEKQPKRKGKVRIHVIKLGDTVSQIAAKYGVSTAAIMRENDLSSSDLRRLREGRKLRIPVSR